MPLDATNLSSIEDVISLYERGFEGDVFDQRAADNLMEAVAAAGGYRYAHNAIHAAGFQGTGEGVLSAPFLTSTRMYPGILPAGSQGRGDCVSWSLRSAAVVSYCTSLWYGENLERYAPPQVSELARRNGVIATEPWYWHRGHSGEGWNGQDAARIALTKCGMVVRKAYPEIGIDLEKYSASTAGRWGASPPPANVVAATNQNLLGTATVCKGWQEVRDMLANGYAIMTTGSEAFSHKRDAKIGLCERSNQRWMHAMSYIAADDRDEVKRLAGCREGGLVLVQNSWSNYCGDEFPIYGSKYMIPAGSFWARWEDVSRRYCVALGGARGFKANPVPRFSLSSII
jgi:hypothetical protein